MYVLGTVPGMTYISEQNKQNSLFCGVYILVNTHNFNNLNLVFSF